MGQQKRERKLTSLNTLPAVHRTKGRSKFREELAGCKPAQPCWRLEAGGRGKGQARPQGQQPYCTANRPPVSNQRPPEILHGQHPQGGSRRDTGCRHPTGAGGDWGWGRGGQKVHAPDWRGPKLRLGPRRAEGMPHLGRLRPSSSWLPELLGPGKAPNAGVAFCSVLLWNTRELEPHAAQGTLHIEQPGA